jgi:hypothetical protein
MTKCDWVGLGLQVFGGLITIVGLHQSKRDLFPQSLGFAPVSFVRKSGRFLIRIFHKPTTVGATASSSIGGLTAHAEAYSTKSSPRTNDLENLREYVIAEVTNLHDRISDSRRAQKAEMRDLQKTTNDKVEQVRDSIVQLGQHVPELVGGKGGRGLEIAAWGVLIAIFGTVISAFA